MSHTRRNCCMKFYEMEQTMKCILVNGYGAVEDVVSFKNDHPKPKLKPKSNQILVRVLACSTSPGDWRTMSGSVDAVRKPDVPYIPSQDICGIVEEVDGNSDFKSGDCIIGTWSFVALGGMAEYALIESKYAVKKPDCITPLEAAALANSSVNAMLAVRDAGVEKGQRILVIGGSSAVGLGIIQLVKDAGASFVATTTTDEPLVKSLGADMVVDYRTQNWWEIPEFKSNPFDKIFDCAEGLSAWLHAKDEGVLKTGWNGGCFIGVVADNPTFELHSMWDIARELSGAMLGRPIWTTLFSLFVPKFKMLFSAPRDNSLAELFKLVVEGRIKAVLDPQSPFPFTEEGAKSAYKLQASRHAHGKIVIQICDKTSDRKLDLQDI